MFGSPEMPAVLAVSINAVCGKTALHIDQMKCEGLLAHVQTWPVARGLMTSSPGLAAGGDVMHELAVHVVDESLEVGLLLGGEVAGRIAGVLQRSPAWMVMFLSFAQRISSP